MNMEEEEDEVVVLMFWWSRDIYPIYPTGSIYTIYARTCTIYMPYICHIYHISTHYMLPVVYRRAVLGVALEIRHIPYYSVLFYITRHNSVIPLSRNPL